jgi:hypothetical protein
MRFAKLSLALLFAPALVAAQSTTTARVESRTEASVKAKVPPPPAHAKLSAHAQARLEAMFEAAREKDLPTEPMEHRVAEGQVKGATEAQIIAAAAHSMAQLEAAHTAMVRAGRAHPSDEEVSRGASVIARGATEAQLQAFVRQAPSDRSLVVAFEVLTDLAARGVPVDRALAVVTSKIEARATDAQLASLGATVGAHGEAGLGAGVGVGAGASAAGKGATSSSTTGSVTGTVTSTLGIGLGRKP